MKKCPKCGSDNPDGVGVCRSCGSPIRSPGLLARLLGGLGRRPPAGETPPAPTAKRTSGPTSIKFVERRSSSADAASLPPEARRAVEEFRRKHPGGQVRISRVSSQSVSPVTVTDEDGVTRVYGSWEKVPEHLREKLRHVTGPPGAAPGGKSEITIEVDGERRTYASIEEVPSEYRALLESLPSEAPPAKEGAVTVTEDGVTRTYESWKDVPPELRARIEAFRKMMRERGKG